MKPSLIAFTGYAGVGKDTGAEPLLAAGYERRAFGDIIKNQVDELVIKHFGFSAHTTDFAQKAKIRRLLEAWGEDNYDAIFTEFFANLPARCVNTRLCRLKEGQEWVRRGGVIVEITRTDVGPATPWEAAQLRDLHRANLVGYRVSNQGSAAELHEKIATLFELPPAPVAPAASVPVDEATPTAV